MVTAEELTVAIRSEGVSETQDDLEGVESAMEDTADSAGTAADDLEGFSQRFQGAMSAAIAGLAVGVAGLAASVPVVGELFSGFGAILESLLFQVDRLARSLGVGGLTDSMFDIADAIFELDGVAGNIVAVLTVIGTLAASVAAGIGAWAVKTMGAVKAGAALVAAVKAVGAALVGIVAGISAVTAALAIAVAAVLAFAVAYLTNFRGVRDSTNEIIGDIFGFFVGLASDLAGWAGDLASDAFGWGRDIITQFIGGLESMLGVVREVLEDMPFIGQILSLFDRLTDALDDIELSGSAQANISQSLSGAFGGSGGGGNGGGASSRPRFGAATGGDSGGSQIDGRQITESTGRYRSDPSNRRGL